MQGLFLGNIALQYDQGFILDETVADPLTMDLKPYPEVMAEALKKLGPDAKRVQVLFITVDPERDTPELLKQYVSAFDPSFLALYGDAAATQRTAKEFKIYYEKRKQGDSYTVDHSAQTYVMDPQGRLRLFIRHDRIASDLPDDLKTLLSERARAP